MKILITGIDGYIGTQMGQVLIDRGHDVTGLDTGFYREGWFYNGVKYSPKVITKDTRKVTQKDLFGSDAIIHLADLSNDPLGQQNKKLTYDINLKGTLRVAKLAKKAGVKRFIYSSSCSVYGVATEEMVTEGSKVNPQTAYAECKVLVEKALRKLADDNFSPTIMRNATVFGVSPRMRFDLVVNNLAGLAWTTKEIKMTSDGSPWRPFIHILDLCQAFAEALEAPKKSVHNQVINVGSSKANYQIREVAKIIAKVFPGCKLSFGKSDGDTRSYKVSFQKIKKVLPKYNPKRTVEFGAKELREVFEKVKMSDEIFQFRGFTRLKEIDHLKKTGQVDKELYWV